MPDDDFLALITPTTRCTLSSWIRDHEGELEAMLLRSGAVLFRDFAVDVDEFAAVADAVSPAPLPYIGGQTPRSEVRPGIFTSTEAAPTVSLAQHCEMSYLPIWPRKVLFFCEQPSESGGQTTLCSNRRLTQQIDRAFFDEVGRRGMLYQRNYREGSPLYPSWPVVFGTSDRSVVEQECSALGAKVEWLGDGRLRTRTPVPGTMRHPETGEVLWFNHLAVLHSSRMRNANAINPFTKRPGVDAETWAVMDPDRVAPEDRIHEVFYGDGGQVPDDAVNAVAALIRRETVLFRWERGDVLVLDNLLALHGRNAFTGQRRVLAALRAPYRPE
jgi:alpha-ketoglutarate-dependent taurine dioxygenase